MRDYEQVCAARDKAVEMFGSIDVMCNFAGGTAVRMLKVAPELEFPDIPIEVYDWGLDVNLKGQFYFDHAVMKQMREQKSGLIVNIGLHYRYGGRRRGVELPDRQKRGYVRADKVAGAIRFKIRCAWRVRFSGTVLTRKAMADMHTLVGRAAEPQEIIDLILFIASKRVNL